MSFFNTRRIPILYLISVARFTAVVVPDATKKMRTFPVLLFGFLFLWPLSSTSTNQTTTLTVYFPVGPTHFCWLPSIPGALPLDGGKVGSFVETRAGARLAKVEGYEVLKLLQYVYNRNV